MVAQGRSAVGAWSRARLRRALTRLLFLTLGIVVTVGVAPAPASSDQPISAGDSAANPSEVRPAIDLTLEQRADARVAVSALLTYTLTATNSGPGTAAEVIVTDSLPPGVEFVGSSNDECGLAAAGEVLCGPYKIAKGESHDVTITVLAPAVGGEITNTATVHPGNGQLELITDNNSASAVTVVEAGSPVPSLPPAVNPSPTNPSPTESVPPAPAAVAPPLPPASPPEPGTFNAISVGTVTLNGIAEAPDHLFLVRSGDVVDVTGGTITITAADGSHGSFAATPFTARRLSGPVGAGAASDVPSAFKITQVATAGALTTLTLVGGDFSTCTKPRSLAAAGTTPVRQLWGSAKGQFRTQARYSSATVRGTIWLTQDQCNGSLISVVESVVDVFDESLKKTISLGPGQSYLALPKKASLKPPTVKRSRARGLATQSPATVKRHGLVWSGKTFRTRAGFEAWLVARGRTWQDFKRTHSALAAALAARH
jgi:uncharacterized repeat protein (TIGR01451 family)